VPFDLCRESGGPIAFDSRSRASFFDACSLRLFDVSSGLFDVEWRAFLIV